MAVHTTQLLGKERVAEGTMEFRFAKPEGFTFRAGQFVEMKLIHPAENDDEGNIRPFSIAAAPHGTELMFATRMRDSAFKRVLGNLKEGSEVELEGPYGSFFLHEDASKPAVFLVGGIGITPFRAMLRDAARRKLPHRIFLFYANRRPEDTPFLNELLAMGQENPNYRFIGTMTRVRESKEEWRGETGHITGAMLRKYLPTLEHTMFYSAGPQGMVSAMREMLTANGVDLDHIRTEEFSGY
ncbi:MAG: FAD-dependent oxidoreductase [Candidatus Liptonbacteria bacterium]|nr:FAD-dependent oxidoreductase [Candidatus Liptonbacteria bacterium]